MAQRETIDPQDWTTIWQSEMSALAVDREAHEALVALSRAGAGARHDGRAAGNDTGDDAAAGRAGADAPPRAAPAGYVPGPGAEIERLRRRVAELERAAGASGGVA